jgi:uncharacterized protein (TIGR00369 family)
MTGLELTGIVPQVLDAILANPLHRACELRVRRAAAGSSRIRFRVNEFSTNITGHLHGGITYAMVDVACFLALCSQLEPGRHGVTVDIHVSVLRPANRGEDMLVRATVDRMGRSLAHMRAEVFADGKDGERLVATGTVTKSIIELVR